MGSRRIQAPRGYPERALPPGGIVDLGALAPGLLEPLLAEEAGWLWERLHWLTARRAEAPRGVAWVDQGRVLGYLGLSLEGALAQAGPLFSSRRYRAQAVEPALLGAAIRGAFSLPAVSRFSGEFPLAAPATVAWLRRTWPDRVAERRMLEAVWEGVAHGGGADPPARIEAWRPELAPLAANLLAEPGVDPDGWQDGVPAAAPGARRLLDSITALAAEGCRFEGLASCVAWNSDEATLSGLVLACRMGGDIGHIAQVAIAAGCRRRGLGTALLLRSLEALRAMGCRATHLVVDGGNQGALALYRQLGFQERHRFPRLRLGPGEAPQD